MWALAETHDETEPLQSEDLLTSYMSEVRELTLAELRSILPSSGPYSALLYDRMLEYPLRDAKALRPALCVATCRALGGLLEGVLKSAAVLELYHNAFLVHDDIEDGSELRRNGPTLHRAFGVPIAVNLGDAMLASSLFPLLENMALLGLGKALRILELVATMSRETAEGQASELEWVRLGRWQVSQREYLRMVHKKTTWYSFIAPIELGAIVASASQSLRRRLRNFATALGAAFQIQDDVLNLVASEERYGKELQGDLWEGKHTLILTHALGACSELERARATEILKKPRPPSAELASLGGVLDGLLQARQMTAQAHSRLSSLLERGLNTRGYKTEDDVQFLQHLIRKSSSTAHAIRIAQRRARFAERALNSLTDDLRPSVHREFLHGVVEFVVNRDR